MSDSARSAQRGMVRDTSDHAALTMTSPTKIPGAITCRGIKLMFLPVVLLALIAVTAGIVSSDVRNIGYYGHFMSNYTQTLLAVSQSRNEDADAAAGLSFLYGDHHNLEMDESAAADGEPLNELPDVQPLHTLLHDSAALEPADATTEEEEAAATAAAHAAPPVDLSMKNGSTDASNVTDAAPAPDFHNATRPNRPLTPRPSAPLKGSIAARAAARQRLRVRVPAARAAAPPQAKPAPGAKVKPSARAMLPPEDMDSLRASLTAVDAAPHPQITRDLAMYDGSGHGVTLRLLHRAHDKYHARSSGPLLHQIALLGGHIFMDRSTWYDDSAGYRINTPRARKWLAQLQSVVRIANAAGVSVPNVTFLVHFDDGPLIRLTSDKHQLAEDAEVPAYRAEADDFLKDGEAEDVGTAQGSVAKAPVFSISKTEDHADVLMPSPEFGIIEKWDSFMRRLQTHVVKQPWVARTGRVVWRGACGSWPRNAPLLELVRTCAARDMLDVAFSGRCAVDRWPHMDTRSVEANERAKGAARKLPFTAPLNVTALASYRYALHVPVEEGAGYGFALPLTLGVGDVPIVVDSPAYEFYHSMLLEGTHFIRVSAPLKAIRVAAQLEANPAAGHAMAVAVEQWFRENLRGVDLARYWLQLLAEYRHVLSFEPQLSDVRRPCTCDRAVIGSRPHVLLQGIEVRRCGLC